jgi:hypothetical protein
MKIDLIKHSPAGIIGCCFLLLLLISPLPADAAQGTGSASMLPSIDVVAGAFGTWTIRYTAADTFISGTIQVVIPNGWTTPQKVDPFSAGYVSVSSAGVLGSPEMIIAGRVITVRVTALDTNQTVDVVYGDHSGDLGGRAVAQMAAQNGIAFIVKSDSGDDSPLEIASSPTLNVIAEPISKLSFVTPPRTFAADGESAVLRVRTEDSFGNPASVSATQKIHLASSAVSGSFSHLGGLGFVDTDTVTIAAGKDTVSFYYRDAVTGTKTLTVAAVGQTWSSVQQAITVQPGTPFKLSVSPEDTTATAGQFVPYKLTVRDAQNNPSPLSNDQTITLTVESPGNFYTKTNHAVPISQIVVPNGQHTVYLDYRNTRKELLVPYLLFFSDQDGAPPTLQPVTANIRIDNAAFDPASSTIGGSKGTVTANGLDSCQVTVTARDAFGNSFDGGHVALSANPVTGNVLRQPSGVTDGSGRAVGSLRSTKAEQKTVTATVDGVSVAGSLVLSYVPGPFSPSTSSISDDKSTVTANGVDSVKVTVVAKDAQGNAISGAPVGAHSP